MPENVLNYHAVRQISAILAFGNAALTSVPICSAFFLLRMGLSTALSAAFLLFGVLSAASDEGVGTTVSPPNVYVAYIDHGDGTVAQKELLRSIMTAIVGDLRRNRDIQVD